MEGKEENVRKATGEEERTLKLEVIISVEV
jgi:hypothetical protein